jgi:hypothetical protein
VHKGPQGQCRDSAAESPGLTLQVVHLIGVKILMVTRKYDNGALGVEFESDAAAGLVKQGSLADYRAELFWCGSPGDSAAERHQPVGVAAGQYDGIAVPLDTMS